MKKATHRTGCASVLTAEEAIARFHVSDGYITSLKVPQPNGSEVRFCEAVAIKEGVWNGLYESAVVLREAAGSMLGRYVMLDHPEQGTEPAWCDTALGQVIGVDVQGENSEIHCLMAMWVNRMPPELTQRIDRREKIGVSVGFTQFYKDVLGDWNGKPYEAVATKIHYTHLAIVPIGACSIEDGCSAQLISQNQEAEDGTTAKKDGEDSELKSGAAESKEVHQAILVDASEAERPPPLFKDPDELLAFTNQALAISDNPELRVEQLNTAFDFVMNTITDYGWTIYTAEDQDSRAAAMASFLARAAAAWKAGDPLFTPPGAAVTVSQSTRSRSWRGDDIPMSEEKHEKKGEGATTTTLYKYPILTQTDDGKPQISWDSTEDQAKFDAGVKDYETAFGGMLGQFNETLGVLDAQAKKGEAADAIARGLLIGGLKTAMPKLTDASLEKYKGMELDTLAGIVTDLGQAVTPVAAPGMEGGEGAPGIAPGSLSPESKKESHAPTQVDLQKLGEKKKFTFLDAAKKFKAETGIDL